MTDLTNYEQFQLERYGNILPPVTIYPKGVTDNNEQEIERESRWVEQQAEQQRLQHENL